MTAPSDTIAQAATDNADACAASAKVLMDKVQAFRAVGYEPTYTVGRVADLLRAESLYRTSARHYLAGDRPRGYASWYDAETYEIAAGR